MMVAVVVVAVNLRKQRAISDTGSLAYVSCLDYFSKTYWVIVFNEISNTLCLLVQAYEHSLEEMVEPDA